METIGDAYMVVGGLPEPNTTHAADVCNQALDMLMCSKMVKDPTDESKNVEVCLECVVYLWSVHVGVGWGKGEVGMYMQSWP